MKNFKKYYKTLLLEAPIPPTPVPVPPTPVPVPPTPAPVPPALKPAPPAPKPASTIDIITNTADFQKLLNNDSIFRLKFTLKDATFEINNTINYKMTFNGIFSNDEHTALHQIILEGTKNKYDFTKFQINDLIDALNEIFSSYNNTKSKTIKSQKINIKFLKDATYKYKAEIKDVDFELMLSSIVLRPAKFISINNKEIYFKKYQEQEKGANADYDNYNKTIKALYSFYKFYFTKLTKGYNLEIISDFESQWSNKDIYKSWPFIFHANFEINPMIGKKKTFESKTDLNKPIVEVSVADAFKFMKKTFVNPIIKMNLEPGEYSLLIPFVPIAMSLAKYSIKNGWPRTANSFEKLIVKNAQDLGGKDVFTSPRQFYIYLKSIQGAKVIKAPESKMAHVMNTPVTDHAKQTTTATAGTGGSNYSAS